MAPMPRRAGQGVEIQHSPSRNRLDFFDILIYVIGMQAAEDEIFRKKSILFGRFHQRGKIA